MVYILVSGSASLYMDDRLVGNQVPGDIMGEIAVIKVSYSWAWAAYAQTITHFSFSPIKCCHSFPYQHSKYTLTGQANEPCEFRTISEKDMRTLAQHYPAEMKSWMDLASLKLGEYEKLGLLDDVRLRRETEACMRRGSTFRMRAASSSLLFPPPDSKSPDMEALRYQLDEILCLLRQKKS